MTPSGLDAPGAAGDAPIVQLGLMPTVLTASAAGNLWLQDVDGCPGCYDDNYGSLSVTIVTTAC